MERKGREGMGRGEKGMREESRAVENLVHTVGGGITDIYSANPASSTSDSGRISVLQS